MSSGEFVALGQLFRWLSFSFPAKTLGNVRKLPRFKYPSGLAVASLETEIFLTVAVHRSPFSVLPLLRYFNNDDPNFLFLLPFPEIRSDASTPNPRPQSSTKYKEG